MSDPLLEAVRALRETTTGRETVSSRYTRARILAGIRQQKRRRVVGITLGIPLAALLIGSVSWAASGQSWSVFARSVLLAFDWRKPDVSLPESLTLPKRSAGGSASALPVSATGSSPNSGLPKENSLSSAVDSPDAVPVRPVVQLSLTTQSSSSGAPSGKPAPRDARITERELELYEQAHVAHFVTKDAALALSAWENYLRAAPGGRFAVEARYNHALCLIRLGQNARAERELESFAAGARGTYRQREAKALIEQLRAAPVQDAQP